MRSLQDWKCLFLRTGLNSSVKLTAICHYPQPNSLRWGTASIVVIATVSKSTWGVKYENEWISDFTREHAALQTVTDGRFCCSPSTVTSLEILHFSLFPPYHSSSHIPLISPQFACRTYPVFLFINYVYISHRHISSVSANWVKLAALCSLWITAYFWLTFLVTKIRKTSTTTQTLLRKTSGESPMPNYVITLFFSLKHLIKPVKFSLLARILILQNGSAIQEVWQSFLKVTT